MRSNERRRDVIVQRRPAGGDPARALDPRLDLEPPATGVRVALFVLAVVLPLAITAAALFRVLPSDLPLSLVAGNLPLTRALLVLGLIALLLPVWAWIDRRLRRHRLVLGAHAIEIETTFHRRALAVTELDLERARIVDLRERTKLKPLLKTHGTGLPGLRSGWYRLRNRRKAFVAMLSGPRVLWIPTRNGYDLLLQPRQPQALLDCLRDMADAVRHR